MATVHTITPVTQWGIWDARMELNLYDWAGNYGVLPSGKHKNELEFSGVSELISFMKGDLILQYKWSKGIYKEMSDEAKRGLDWLENEDNRRVGPVEWQRVKVNDNVSALEPTVITPES